MFYLLRTAQGDHLLLAVVGPGFSRGGCPNYQIWILLQFFAENCMKMKEFGPSGGMHPLHPLRSATDLLVLTN